MTTMNIPELEAKDKARFWIKIDQKGAKDCWEWKAGTDECGYGKFRLLRKSYIAHRLVYFLTHGPIPKGLCVCHTCDNPPCCNPRHLWLGTFDDNMADKRRKKRGRCVRGEAQHLARLNRENVYIIRDLLKQGVCVRKIATTFDVGWSTIWCIKRGLSWAHFPNP